MLRRLYMLSEDGYSLKSPHSRHKYLKCRVHGTPEGNSNDLDALRITSAPLAVPQAMSRRHWLRNFLTHGFHLLVLLVVGGAVRDTQCGFKVSPPLMRELQLDYVES